MIEEIKNLRHCMLFEFQKVSNVMEAKKNNNVTRNSNSSSMRWFVKFCLGDYSLTGERRLGRESEVSDEMLCSIIRTNTTLPSAKVGIKLGIHQPIDFDYIKRCGSVSKVSLWMPQELSEINLIDI
ncbi:UNVERIFIED_CONTAM: Histone-lysine N-methyltransferase SETMAR [Trichonephila clavipes]